MDFLAEARNSGVNRTVNHGISEEAVASLRLDVLIAARTTGVWELENLDRLRTHPLHLLTKHESFVLTLTH